MSVEPTAEAVNVREIQIMCLFPACHIINADSSTARSCDRSAVDTECQLTVGAAAALLVGARPREDSRRRTHWPAVHREPHTRRVDVALYSLGFASSNLC